MRLNKVTSVMVLAGLIMSFSASSATLTMNDDTNTISGLNTSQMLSKNNGSTWVAYSDASQNSFPGKVTIAVAVKDDMAIKAVDWDPNIAYSTEDGVDTVRYNGYYWTNKWYADGSNVPGQGDPWVQAGKIEINTLATFNFTPWSGQKATDFQNSEKTKVANQRKVIGYFPEWGVYDAHNNFTANKVDFSRLTHLNYGFGIVSNTGEISIQDTNAALTKGTLPDLEKMSEANGVTFMISFGGWNNSEQGVFEAATATTAGINTLADNMISFMQQYGFDGIDIDWEYPDTNAEKAQFTQLIQTLRSKLDTLGKSQDKYYQLSAAVTTNHNNIQYINPSVTAGLLDSVNVMAYDIHGAFDPITGHNAPLFANSKDSDPLLNVASAMNEYSETWGVPKSKLMMGIPYYGRGWGDVEPTIIVKGLPGLFAKGSATVHGAWDDTDQYTGTNPYYDLKTKLASGKYVRYWDNESKVPYLYNPATKEFLTYDDPESIQAKVNYLNQQGFGGAIIWDLSGDTSDYELGSIVGTLKGSEMPDGEGGDDNPALSMQAGVYKSGRNNLCIKVLYSHVVSNQPETAACSNVSDQLLSGTSFNEIKVGSSGSTCLTVTDQNVIRTTFCAQPSSESAPKAQQWYVENNRFVNNVNGQKKCISVTDNNGLVASTCDSGNGAQVFSKTDVFNTGFYQSASNGKCIDENTKYPGTSATATCDGNIGQKITLTSDGSHFMKRVSKRGVTSCFNVPASNLQTGYPVVLGNCLSNYQGMKWQYEDGKFVSLVSGDKYCMSAGTAANAYVTLKKCDDSDQSQIFKEVNVSR
ncbi:glycosyl hydrolase family 18 protein [Enterobacillus tribolii]|nr:glycosyl hydrolase family 18 protein [Enterobacillus tribolii]MBW7985046.1 hypothetical protein [Enterobacillus tribolii]